jgi:hypothetical protein
MRRILIALRQLYGLPCWGVKRGYGTSLTIDFGRPQLRIREPYKTAANSRRLRSMAARRLVWVRGDWRLWIYCCDWAVFERSRPIGGSDTTRSADRAAHYLDGQKLMRAQVILRGMRTLFHFDLGGRLETKPFDRTSEQWFLYEPNGNVLTVRADRRYSYGSGNRQPDRKRWLEIDA